MIRDRGSRRLVEPSRGQALVEFALVLPLFVLILLAIFDFGRVIWAKNSLENAAREGARLAIVHGDSIDQTCPIGPSAGIYAATPTASASCPNPAPSKQMIYDQVRAYAWAGGVRPTSCTTSDTSTTGPCITVCYGTACSGDTNSQSSTVRGTPITVSATSDIYLIVPRILGFTVFTVKGTSSMLVNS